MVFIELLKKYDKEVKLAVEELFQNAFNNQRRDTDMLLVIIHGYHNSKFSEFYKREKLSPYVFGPDHIGFSLNTFYEFFDFYRKGYTSKKRFLRALKGKRYGKKLEHQERLTLNIELLIYLKFWESDMLLRQLFNLANLASGKYYDWEFMLSYSRRAFIRNEIQAPVKEICPRFHQLVNDTYSAQIRNAVAHSKYFFLGRNLQLANKEENEHYELFNVPFADWEIRFHKTLLFYNYMIGGFQKYDKMYQDEVKDKHFGLPVSTPKLSQLGQRISQWVKYDERYNRWLWSEQIDE